VTSFDADRFGQGGTLPGAGSVPRPAGLLGPGPVRNPYPVYGEGAGLGVGSASEETRARGKCCGASLGSSSGRTSPAATVFTGSALEAEPSRGDLLGAPSVAVPALEPAPRVAPPARPLAFVAARPSPFALPTGRDCEDAPCEGVVRARDWMVRFVRTGATWPAIPRATS